MRLNVFADTIGSLSATWFSRGRVTGEHARQNECSAYLGLGEALRRLGREDEARVAFEKAIYQAERFGRDGRAKDLRLAMSEPGN
jgi:hypothetical protein